ncbi:hypothetical protein AX289_27580 [Methylorubrum populi]|nr:hypothetical protein AX289_27580 [Methylorubrum populi]
MPAAMPDDDAALKAAIERPETILLYGVPRERTPVLVAKVFGNGAKLVEMAPVNSIPQCYVLRVDGSWSLSIHDPEPTLGSHTDEIVQAIADEFGISESEDDAGEPLPDEDRAPWPAIDMEIRVYWRARTWPEGYGPVSQPAPAASA